MRYDAIIVGAGAAGLYCALHAGRRGRRVLVLERNTEPGAKILISGGGRCNFTNINTSADRFLSTNPHFARSALTRHGPQDFLALLQRHHIAYYEKTLGQLFCEGARSAQKIVRMLMDECAAGRVDVRTGQQISDTQHVDGTFVVTTRGGAAEADKLVLASGGLSIPKLGASAFSYETAKRFGLPVQGTRPGLVPLTFGAHDLAWMQPLSGVSTEVIARAGAAAFRESALFTHRGLSGPAILQASSYWRAGEDIVIDWLPDASAETLAQIKRARPKALLRTALAELLPDRLAVALCAGFPQAMLGDLKDAALADITAQLKAWRLAPTGTEGYAKAEVTVGGVDTSALSQQTLEARAVPGLFCIGEAVDVTGWLGGYNFQWAWSSGWAAAQAL